VTVLEQLAAWFQVNGEAIQGTDPMYPSSDSGAYLTSRNKTVYIIVPSTPPDRTDGTTSQLWAALHGQARHPFVAQDTSNLTLPWFRPNLMRDTLVNVTLLGKGPVAFEMRSEGLVISHSTNASVALLRTYFSSNRSVSVSGAGHHRFPSVSSPAHPRKRSLGHGTMRDTR
jgi:hypothetical protein